MRAVNFLRILALAATLSAYSWWSLSQREVSAVHIEAPGGGIPLVRLEQADALWHDPSTLFVDVRSETDYEFGHIAGAINLPEHDFETVFPALKPRLERARTIVVYCKSMDCGQSLWAAVRLRNEGLKQTVIYPKGWNEWFNHGLPIVRLRER